MPSPGKVRVCVCVSCVSAESRKDFRETGITSIAKQFSVLQIFISAYRIRDKLQFHKKNGRFFGHNYSTKMKFT